MSATPLRLFEDVHPRPLPTRGRRPRRDTEPREPRPLSLVEKFRKAATGRNWPAFAIAGAAGSFVPAASFYMARYELATRPELLPLVGAALVFSCLSVYDLAVPVFDSKLKAACFALLAEGVLVLSGSSVLAGVALALLIVSNCTASGVALALEDGRYRAEARCRRK